MERIFFTMETFSGVSSLILALFLHFSEVPKGEMCRRNKHSRIYVEAAYILVGLASLGIAFSTESYHETLKAFFIQSLAPIQTLLFLWSITYPIYRTQTGRIHAAAVDLYISAGGRKSDILFRPGRTDGYSSLLCPHGLLCPPADPLYTRLAPYCQTLDTGTSRACALSAKAHPSSVYRPVHHVRTVCCCKHLPILHQPADIHRNLHNFLHSFCPAVP